MILTLIQPIISLFSWVSRWPILLHLPLHTVLGLYFETLATCSMVVGSFSSWILRIKLTEPLSTTIRVRFFYKEGPCDIPFNNRPMHERHDSEWSNQNKLAWRILAESAYPVYQLTLLLPLSIATVPVEPVAWNFQRALGVKRAFCSCCRVCALYDATTNKLMGNDISTSRKSKDRSNRSTDKSTSRNSEFCDA